VEKRAQRRTLLQAGRLFTAADYGNLFSFPTSRFVAYGFNIDGNLLAQHCLIALAYFVVLCVYGNFFLKSREIAA